MEERKNLKWVSSYKSSKSLVNNYETINILRKLHKTNIFGMPPPQKKKKKKKTELCAKLLLVAIFS